MRVEAELVGTRDTPTGAEFVGAQDMPQGRSLLRPWCSVCGLSRRRSDALAEHRHGQRIGMRTVVLEQRIVVLIHEEASRLA